MHYLTFPCPVCKEIADTTMPTCKYCSAPLDVAALAAAEPERRAREAKQAFVWGPVNSALVCPHCQTKGGVHTKMVKQKVGVSGGKATAAVLTGGISLLATGLSRKQTVTQAHCGSCNSTWHF